MAITVRVDSKLEQELEAVAKAEGVTKSNLIRECLVEYLKSKRSQLSPWELGKDLFGKSGSGKGNLARDRKQIVREKIHGRKKSD